MIAVIEIYFWGIFLGGITVMVIFAYLFYTKCITPEIDQWIEQQLQQRSQNARPVITVSHPIPIPSFPGMTGSQPPPQLPPPPPGSILTSIKTQNNTYPAFSYSGPLQKLSVADRDILYTSLGREKSTLPDVNIQVHEANIACGTQEDPANECSVRIESGYVEREETVDDEDDVIRVGDSATSEASYLPVTRPQMMRDEDASEDVFDDSWLGGGSCFSARPWNTMSWRRHQAVTPRAPASLVERCRSTAGQKYFSPSLRMPLSHHFRSSFSTKQAFLPASKEFEFQSYRYEQVPQVPPRVPAPVTLNPHYSIPVTAPKVPITSLEKSTERVSFYSGEPVPETAKETSKGFQRSNIPRNFHFHETVYASIKNSRLKREEDIFKMRDLQHNQQRRGLESSIPVSKFHHHRASELSDISAILPVPPSVQQSRSTCNPTSEISSGGNTSVEVHKHNSTESPLNASAGTYSQAVCDCPENPFSSLSTSLVCSSYKEAADVMAMEPTSLKRSNSSGLQSHAASLENLEQLEASLNVSCDTGILETISELNSMSLKRVKEKKLIYRPGLLPFNSLTQLYTNQTPDENDNDALSAKNDCIEIAGTPRKTIEPSPAYRDTSVV